MIKSLMYLDYNCFQRGFDDFRQIRIKLEALACEEILWKAERKIIELAWSFMHEDENMLCPFMERKLEILRLSELCRIKIGPEEKILILAKNYQKEARLSSRDAIHLACAYYAGCKFFLSCDDKLVKHASILDLEIKIMNPLEYMREENRK